MKLIYFTILILFSIKLLANRPRYQYCVSYCLKEDTVFDENRKPVITNGEITYHCINKIFELRNGDCPQENNIGLNSSSSPTQCYRLKNYNGQGFQGDGNGTYKDANNVEWTYSHFPREGESDNPKSFVSYSKKTGEMCLEIPLLKYKLVLFNLSNLEAKEGYYEQIIIEGSKLVLSMIKESKPHEPTNPVESKITYDFTYLFEAYRNSLIVTNPNPFLNEIKVMLAKEVLDSNANLKMVLKDNAGKKIAEQPVEGTVTTLNTTFVDRGKYMLFLYKKEEILDYKQMFK